MQHLFLDTRVLDARARKLFSLTEDSMMECAALALKHEVCRSIESKIEKFNKHILILAGSGNNGGDGYALARLLAVDSISAIVCTVAEPKSEMGKLQKERCAHLKALSFISLQECLTFMQNEKQPFDVVVDCIFGSGFHGALPSEIESLIIKVNGLKAVKIACDVPSGLDQLGNAAGVIFKADCTVTMGAQKVCLYSDKAKECTGIVKVADLGISRAQFEQGSYSAQQSTVLPVAELLEQSDMTLPHRSEQNVNKGSFGHVAVVVGEKIGAAVIAGSSAFRFGAGLVTLVGKSSNVFPGKEIVLDDDGQPPVETISKAETRSKYIVPYDLMCSETFPANTTAIALGMGLGHNETYFSYLNEHAAIPCVLDADVFSSDALYAFLQSRVHAMSVPNTVLTPHPKEFVSLLQKCDLGTYTIIQVSENRIELVKKFCETFPGVVLLLKGSVVTIGVKYAEEREVRLYMNPYGTNALAKGGSGDVLSGMIAALLAQKKKSYTTLNATISASLAHAIASSHAPCDYSLTPFSLMKLVSEL